MRSTPPSLSEQRSACTGSFNRCIYCSVLKVRQRPATGKECDWKQVWMGHHDAVRRRLIEIATEERQPAPTDVGRLSEVGGRTCRRRTARDGPCFFAVSAAPQGHDGDRFGERVDSLALAERTCSRRLTTSLNRDSDIVGVSILPSSRYAHCSLVHTRRRTASVPG